MTTPQALRGSDGIQRPTRLPLTHKVAAAFIGAAGLALASGAAGLMFVLHIKADMEVIVGENAGRVRAVSELHLALLEQRGLVASYIHDGNHIWIDELGRKEPAFRDWLRRVRELAFTPDKRRLLIEIDALFERYDSERDGVVALRNEGSADEAWSAFTGRVKPLHDKLSVTCDLLVSMNQAAMDASVASWRSAARKAQAVLMGGALLSVAVSIALFVFLARGVLLPLRRMADDARAYARGDGDGITFRLADDVRVVGGFVDALKSDVATTRFDLAKSRDRLADAEKLAALGKLAASVAHEIRNPPTSLKIRLFTIRRALEGNPHYENDLDVVSGEIERLESIVRSFLEFSRPPRLQRVPCDIGSLLDEVIRLAHDRLARREITVTYERAHDLPAGTADPQQLKQVFLNLLDNAAEAMPDGGIIRVTAGSEAGPDGTRTAVIRVSDHRMGVSEEVCARIFEPFFSTKPEGTGLGLCIAEGIVARHGGQLTLDSTSAAGSTFVVRLPLNGDGNAR